MGKKCSLCTVLKIAAAIAAVAAAVCLIVVYSDEIVSFFRQIKEKIQEKLPSSAPKYEEDDEFSDYEDYEDYADIEN